MSPSVDLSFATWAPGTMGGSERSSVALARALGELDAPDLRVRALVPEGVPSAALGVRTVVVRGPVPAGGPRRALALAAGLLMGRRRGRGLDDPADITHHLFTVPVVRPPGRTVITLHDAAHRDVPELFPRAERAFRAVAYDAVARRADAVVVPSEHARDRAAERIGVAPERLHVIGHGVDHAIFRPPGDDVPRPSDLPARYVVYPARAWPHKNHVRLVQALAATADPDLVLLLTGGADAGALEAIRDAARAAGVDHRVRHAGHVTDAELARIYGHAEALVVPSLYEGYGLPVVEAMACGTAVAVAARGALPEVAGGAGVLFDPLDVTAIAAAIDTATSPGAERDARRVRGLGLARARTWEAAASAHTDLYRRLESAG